MATSDPIQSYGEFRLINSNGDTTNPDNAWSYGESGLLHEYPGLGEWCWGHDTGVDEKYIGNLADGAGTATVTGTGNSENLTINNVEYWILPAVQTGAVEIKIVYDKYQAGSGSGLIQYRTGATRGACETVGWNAYAGHFTSLGWIQARTLVFTPSGSPRGWWPADQIAGLEDGDPVGTWPDQTNDNDLTQANADKKPTFQSDVGSLQSGLPVVRFDGGDDFMQTAVWVAITQPNTVFIAFHKDNDATDTNYVFESVATANWQHQALWFWVGQPNIRLNAGTAVLMDKNNTQDPCLITCVFNGAASYIRINTDQSANADAGAHDMEGLILGAYWNGTSEWTPMDCFEVIVYDGAENPADNEDGLNLKWSLY